MRENKPILYLDMDGVLVDFDSAVSKISEEIRKQYRSNADIPGIFGMMEPMPGALDAVDVLREKYDLYILSTAPWRNDSALQDKMNWIKRYFGAGKDSIFYKKVIFSANKHLQIGEILIDDRLKNGAGEFSGRHIHFGTEEFPDWESVLRELLQ